MEECRKTSGIQVSAEPLELSVGGVWKLQLLSWVAQGCFGDTHMQAPLVATRARIVKIFELSFPSDVLPLQSPALGLVFSPTPTHTQRQE